jgi:hypothetical protein
MMEWRTVCTESPVKRKDSRLTLLIIQIAFSNDIIRRMLPFVLGRI